MCSLELLHAEKMSFNAGDTVVVCKLDVYIKGLNLASTSFQCNTKNKMLVISDTVSNHKGGLGASPFNTRT